MGDESEKLAKVEQAEVGLPRSKLEELDVGDERDERDEREDDGLLPQPQAEKPAEPAKNSFTAALMWMVLNTLATIGIVSLGALLPGSSAAPSHQLPNQCRVFPSRSLRTRPSSRIRP